MKYLKGIELGLHNTKKIHKVNARDILIIQEKIIYAIEELLLDAHRTFMFEKHSKKFNEGIKFLLSFIVTRAIDTFSLKEQEETAYHICRFYKNIKYKYYLRDDLENNLLFRMAFYPSKEAAWQTHLKYNIDHLSREQARKLYRLLAHEEKQLDKDFLQNLENHIIDKILLRNESLPSSQTNCIFDSWSILKSSNLVKAEWKSIVDAADEFYQWWCSCKNLKQITYLKELQVQYQFYMNAKPEVQNIELTKLFQDAYLNDTNSLMFSPDILKIILGFLAAARDLKSMSLTCKYLNQIVEDSNLWSDTLHAKLASGDKLFSHRFFTFYPEIEGQRKNYVIPNAKEKYRRIIKEEFDLKSLKKKVDSRKNQENNGTCLVM